MAKSINTKAGLRQFNFAKAKGATDDAKVIVGEFLNANGSALSDLKAVFSAYDNLSSVVDIWPEDEAGIASFIAELEDDQATALAEVVNTFVEQAGENH